MMHESWLLLPPEPAAAVNWVTSARVQWPGDPWAGVAALPPPHAVTVNAVTAAASDPARRSRLLRALMNTMIPSLIQASPVWTGFVSFDNYWTRPCPPCRQCAQ
jgi:hypothetical protein